jgi:hypothetical protein
LRNADNPDKEEQVKQLEALFMNSVESIDVHREAQDLQNVFTHGQQVFTVNVHPQPRFEHFKDFMLSARGRNVRLLHLSGHGDSRCGFFWLKAESTAYEKIPVDTFAKMIKTEVAGEKGGTIECVVLNACETEYMGKELKSAGVPHVVCWRSKVLDNTATNFALQFYKSLKEQGQQRNYKLAFQHAVARMDLGGGAARHGMKHLAAGAVDYVCLLSDDGDEFPDTGFIRADDRRGSTCSTGENIPDPNESGGYEGQDDESTRNWREPDILADGTRVDRDTDYAAHAGQAERKCMELLGFPMTLPGKSEPIKVGEGIDSNGFIKNPDVLKMSGVCSYTSGVWGFDKSPIRRENKAIEKGRLVMRSPGGSNTIGLAVQALAEVEKHRVNDMRQHENDNLLGLKWEKTINPGRGRSLRNSGLATALTRKTEFTKQEWESFGITDLHKDDFIKLDIWTFVPEIKNRCPGTCPTNLKCASCQSLLKPKWNCADCKRLNCKNCGSRETHEYQLKQITDTREALEKLIQDDPSAGVAALSVTTRGAGTCWKHADDGVRSIQMSEANASGLSIAAGATLSHAQITPAQHQVNTERAETFSTIDDWLRSIALEDYAAAIKQYGYNSFQALDAASEEEIIEMTQDPHVEMKKPHSKLFLVEWRKRVQTAGS